MAFKKLCFDSDLKSDRRVLWQTPSHLIRADKKGKILVTGVGLSFVGPDRIMHRAQLKAR
jgi:hypothetical protein